MASVINNYAPICAMPGCTRRVGYRKKYKKEDGSLGAKWSACCTWHRSGGGKETRLEYLRSKGCANRDGHVTGRMCKDPNSPSLTFDHIDGNKMNSDPANIDVLCANCHNEKSKQNGDTLGRYNNVVELDSNLFEMKA